MTFTFNHPNYYKKLKDPKEVEIEKVFRALNKKDWEEQSRLGYCESAKKQIREHNRRKAEEIVAERIND